MYEGGEEMMSVAKGMETDEVTVENTERFSLRVVRRVRGLLDLEKNCRRPC